MKSDQIFDFWKAYNQYLIEIVRQIPAKNPFRLSIGRDGQKFSLKFSTDDDAEQAAQYLTPAISY